MLGEYLHSIDPKGRLFMPAKLREDLGESFYMCKDNKGECLFVYSEATWVKLVDSINKLPMNLAREAQKRLFPTACKCETDSQGRILITQKLREYAKLEKNATVIGMGNHVEIWSTDAWEAESAKLAGDELENIFNMISLT